MDLSFVSQDLKSSQEKPIMAIELPDKMYPTFLCMVKCPMIRPQRYKGKHQYMFPSRRANGARHGRAYPHAERLPSQQEPSREEGGNLRLGLDAAGNDLPQASRCGCICYRTHAIFEENKFQFGPNVRTACMII